MNICTLPKRNAALLRLYAVERQFDAIVAMSEELERSHACPGGEYPEFWGAIFDSRPAVLLVIVFSHGPIDTHPASVSAHKT